MPSQEEFMFPSFRGRMILAAVLCGAAAFAAATSECAAAESKKLNASREQVAAACDSSGGFQWGTGSDSGRYGCMTENAWVECDANGKCEGGQASATADRRTVRGADSKLLQAME